MKKLFRKITAFLSKPPVSTLLACWMAFVSTGLGGSMILNPSSYYDTPSYRVAMQWASPYFWGALFVGAGVVLLASMIHEHKQAQLPALALGAVYMTLAVAVSPTLIGGGVASPVWMYIGNLGTCVLIQYACSREVPRDTTTNHHV